MEKLLNFIKSCFGGNGLKIDFGWRDRNRREEITEALEILIASNETKKLEIFKKLLHNYVVVDQIEKSLECIPFDEKFDKYGVCLVLEYMFSQLDTFKRGLTGVMTAMAKDENLEKFYKGLMRWDEDEKDVNTQS